MGDTSRLYEAIVSGKANKEKGNYFIAACDFKIATYVYNYGDPYGYFPKEDPYKDFIECYRRLSEDEKQKMLEEDITKL